MLHTLRNMAGELAAPIKIEIPARWTARKRDTIGAVGELSQLAELLVRSCDAIHGLYMRCTDIIRDEDLTDAQVRQALEPHFPQSRISEILRVSRAPDEVYCRYRAGFFGFKAALRQCRGYTITPGPELQRRKIRRTAERLVMLLGGAGTITIRGHTVTVQ